MPAVAAADGWVPRFAPRLRVVHYASGLHERPVQPSSPKAYRCPVCPKTYALQGHFLRHVSFAHR